MELKEGMYCYDKCNRKAGIGKIISFQKNNNVNIKYKYDIDLVSIGNVVSSNKIIDLIEYMDILELEGNIETIDGKTIRLFNPVRCDGFTKYDDGTRCIILNLDYIVSIDKLKIKSVVTKEQFESMKYEV